MLAPFLSAKALALLQHPIVGGEKHASSEKNINDASWPPKCPPMGRNMVRQARGRAESVMNALRSNTIRNGGLPGEVRECQLWSTVPDPVRRSETWRQLWFVELATITCYGYAVSDTEVVLRLRLQALVSKGYAPTPTPKAPHVYRVCWPLVGDAESRNTWLYPWLPRLEWQCQLSECGLLSTKAVQAVDSADQQQIDYTVENVQMTDKRGCRVECTLKIPLAHFS